MICFLTTPPLEICSNLPVRNLFLYLGATRIFSEFEGICATGLLHRGTNFAYSINFKLIFSIPLLDGKGTLVYVG